MNIASMLSGGLANIFSGGALGVIGAIGSGYLDLQKTKESNKQELAIMEANRQFAITQAGSAVALEAEKRVAASYQQDTAAYTGELSWVDALRGSLRPIVTYLLLGVSIYLALWAFARVSLDQVVISEIAKFSVFTCLDLATMCVAWYFGARQIDKINRSAVAVVAAKKGK